MMRIFNFLKKIFGSIIVIVMILSFQNINIITETKVSNNNLNKNLNLNAMAKVMDNFVKNDIYNVLDTYYGTLTGYVANCPMCSGKLGCTGQNVLDGTTTYNDENYGTVRIVASSTSLACGSIVRFANSEFGTNGYVTAIVLDRGVTGTTLDLLVDSSDTAIKKIGSKKINYDILRYGWKR